MERHFEGKKEAVLYKRYRPVTPLNVVDRIMKYVNEKHEGPLESVVDVGCGSGQNTLVFSPYFETVLGTDISASMVAEVASDPTLPFNVSFEVSPAESLPVADSSVDLVTGAQCFHWFDQERFHQEMNRVLKPNGVVAIIGHDPEFLIDPHNESKSDELGNVVVDYLAQLQPCMRKAAMPIMSRYATVQFPYDDVIREINIRHDVAISVADYIGVLETFSPFQKLQVEQPNVAIEIKDKLIKNLRRILEVDDETPLEDIATTMRLENFLLMGRKKSSAGGSSL